ncbi:MAG: CHAT domain-containing protein, partial [Gammaproteobacteria bacterium]|nr:CHAT domain-containing protein [Gammaproteobacteria bacterium]
KVGPEQLATVFNDCGRYPRVLFLSGCRSGESYDNLCSFSEQLVRLGIPVVLGWTLPVNDVAATEAACYFYEQLSIGASIAQALLYARRTLFAFEQKQQENSSYSRPQNWHLLRLYSDATPLDALVTAPRLWTRQVRAESKSRFLDPAGQQTEVCARRDFIGRRRLMQRCLAALRRPATHSEAEQGVLLHGLDGMGKSSVAARLADRLQADCQLLVWRGKMDETALLQGLQDHLSDVTEILNQSQQS